MTVVSSADVLIFSPLLTTLTCNFSLSDLIFFYIQMFVFVLFPKYIKVSLSFIFLRTIAPLIYNIRSRERTKYDTLRCSTGPKYGGLT